ncbi:cytochrome c oxidase subunit II [Opitutus terrae]|uniref:cytochrome-c oxidase n=1 Tax=Opitutus terrae (strain DSM 11246 / JCM 15787 / PB90-1) TaxID=452637 RepID=B1ZMS7_OPITP|nr:cytochrome c oxidase subunit II [Opitutus terrae]ACB75355.1 cytochrome c oxidase, subunit II [Opitutus terrae PB90-1]
MRSFSLPTETPWRSRLTRWLRSGLALGALALLPGCDLKFWRMDGPMSAVHADGPVARAQAEVFHVTVWVVLVIFVLVGSTLAYAILKFRARNAADEHAAPPPQSHGNPLIELSLIGASVLALVVIAVPTLKGIWYTHDVPAEEKADAYPITAQGYQWWFRFEYPNEQIPNVGSLVTSNELVIPAGRPVRIDLRGMDVIHSFWVPRLAGKVDMIPNRANFLWLKADEPGYFWGQCAEYCGDSHAVMRFRVIALGPREFNEWLEQQIAPARVVPAAAPANAGEPAKAQFASYKTDWKRNEPGYSEEFDLKPLESWRAQQFPAHDEDPALIAKGRQLFQSKTCFSCHSVRGHFVGGSAAYPDLTHLGSRTTIAAGLLQNTPEQLARWLAHPNVVKPGNRMWTEGYQKNNIQLTPDDVTALVAYLQSLK